MEQTAVYTAHTGTTLAQALAKNLGRNRFYIQIGKDLAEVFHVWENTYMHRKSWQIDFKPPMSHVYLVLDSSARITVKSVTTT